jgi:hypothetical protein
MRTPGSASFKQIFAPVVRQFDVPDMVVARASPAPEGQVFEDEVHRQLTELTELTNQPRRCRSDTIMARILAEKSFILQVYDLFGEAQPLHPSVETVQSSQRL